MPMAEHPPTAEHARLAEATGRAEDDLFAANPWYEWGPYLSERAWGTVREDYSESGDAWDYVPARPRPLARVPLERGRHGRASPTSATSSASRSRSGTATTRSSRSGCSASPGRRATTARTSRSTGGTSRGCRATRCCSWRYHYPQAAFPYEQLVNHGRGLHDPELELLDTGVFDDDRYWSVDVTYAKASPTEVLMRIELENHGPDEATLDVLPTLWFRNTWSWGGDGARPRIEGDGDGAHGGRPPRSPATGSTRRPAPTARRPRRSSARTRRTHRASSAPSATTPYPKDGINDHVVSGAATVNPDGLRHQGRAPLPRDRAGRRQGRAAAAAAPARDERRAGRDLGRRRVRRGRRRPRGATPTSSTPRSRRRARRPSRCRSCARRAPASSGASRCTRTTCARWLDGDPGEPPPPEAHRHGRNSDWRHLDAFDVLAMPDPWEYPWFAAWDLGFHAIPWAHLDPAFAKYQLVVLLREWFQHPNGALPAYEWNFDDVNPPVHVMAALRVFLIDGGTRPRVPRARSSRSC